MLTLVEGSVDGWESGGGVKDEKGGVGMGGGGCGSDCLLWKALFGPQQLQASARWRGLERTACSPCSGSTSNLTRLTLPEPGSPCPST